MIGVVGVTVGIIIEIIIHLIVGPPAIDLNGNVKMITT